MKHFPRIAAFSALFFAAGVYLYSFNHWLLIITAILIFLFIGLLRKEAAAAFIVAAALFAGFFNTDFVLRKGMSEAEAFLDRTDGFICRVSSIPYRSNDYISAIVTSDGTKISIRAVSADFEYGDMLYVSGTGEVSKSLYDYDNGAFLTLYAEKIIKTGEDIKLYRISDFAVFVRQKLLSAADSLWGGETLMFARSVLLGSREYSSEEFLQKLSMGSISHMVAISGLHVSIAAFGVLYLIKRITENRYARFLCLPAAAFFVIMTGSSPSSIRALLMFTLYLSAKTLYAYYDGYTSLGVAALAILAVDPFSAYSLSFMLSFAAVLGITAFSQPIKKSLCFLPGSLAEAFAASISAQVFTFPILAAAFGSVPLTALLANLFAVPLLPFIMGAGYAAVFLKLFGVNFLLAEAADFLIGFVLKTAELAAKLPFANIKIHTENALLFFLFWALAVGAMCLYYKAKKKMAAFALVNVSLLCLTLSFIFRVPVRDGFYYFGGSALACDEEARVLFVGDDAESAKDYLDSLGVKSVDVLVYTKTEAKADYPELADDLAARLVVLTRDDDADYKKAVASKGDVLTAGNFTLEALDGDRYGRGYILDAFGTSILFYEDGEEVYCPAVCLLSGVPDSFDYEFYDDSYMIDENDIGRYFSPEEMEEL